MKPDSLPPHDEKAEWLLVACVLEQPDIILEIEPNSFYCQAQRMVFDMIQLAVQKRSKDPYIEVMLELNRDNPHVYQQLQKAQDELVSAANWPTYWEIVEEMKRSRDILAFTAEITEEARAGNLDPESITERSKRIHDRSVDRTLTGMECGTALANDLQRRSDMRGQHSGLATGFHKLDSLTDGLQPGEQTIIAARPSVGKTALACNIIDRVCLVDGHRTLVVTLEMSPAALSRRLMAGHHSISMNVLKNGNYTENDFVIFAQFNSILRNKPIQMLDCVGGMDIGHIASAIRRAHRKDPLKLVVVDYLQKIRATGKHEKRTYEIGEVSGILKALAVETGAAFLTLAQLNRESEKEKGRRPRLSDLADSGQIERDADTVGLLHKSKDKPEEVELNIAKQRDGETGIVPLTFNGKYCRFENR